MDEPSDYFPSVITKHTIRGDSLTITTQNAQAATISGANAQSAACWGVYSIDGRTIIAPSVSAALKTTPPRRLGWEGHGPQAKDDPESNHFDNAMKRLEQAVERMHREMAGAKVANAITAIHGQHTRDGRPSRFIQEVE